ncbi:MAG TPA: aldo/keto reductase [Candidatus Udaeobacter sp.]|jgi:diketogulonate reductase-like aldo/keto reductase
MTAILIERIEYDYERERRDKMKTVTLPDGERVPALGQGTWRMGENKRAHNDEVAALRLGIELGMTLIDTAEMYGDGGAEEVVADAIEGQRDRVFIVTKVYPHNASRTELPKACERSLKRLRIDVIDLYLLHWRERRTRMAETVETFEKLRTDGKIKRWGVSNLDVDDMNEVWSMENGTNCAANQVLYNLENREIESGLLRWSEENEVPIMAYSPVGHGRGLLENTALKEIARRHNTTPSQIALTWVLRQPGMIAIPKASNEEHVRENARSIDIKLTKNDLAELDREFPAPKSKRPLPTL